MNENTKPNGQKETKQSEAQNVQKAPAEQKAKHKK
jgi:hypothetical protein